VNGGGIRKVGIGEGDVGEGRFNGLSFSLTKKHFGFTVPRAFSLLPVPELGFFTDFH
jgi:hypothetical protein